MNERIRRVYCKTCKVLTVNSVPAHAEHSTVNVPSNRSMKRWVMDGVAKATDGCRVEPDGSCPHGHQSWLIVVGVI